MDLNSLLAWIEDKITVVSERTPRWLVISLSLLYASYKFSTWHFGVFRRLGVKGPRPLPMVGTLNNLMRMGIREHDLAMKQQYGSVVGTFVGRQPAMLVYDLDMLKTILVKDFQNFRNRKDPAIPDEPFDKFIHTLKDDHWKHVRNILSPAFSTGKLRKMERQIENCARTLLANLQQKADNKETFDFHEYCGAYTMDVIASTGFGIEIDSHSDPNNQFVRMSKRAFEFHLKDRKAILLFFFPFLMKPLSKIGVSFFPREITEFFITTVSRVVAERRTDPNDTKIDLLQLMINAEVNREEADDKEDDDEDAAADSNSSSSYVTSTGWKREQPGLTHDEVLAQGIFFLIAGYETTSNTLAFLGYLLAVNGDCQDKLLAEIDDIMQGQDHVTYDILKNMPYLDMCMSETLRMYPAGPRTDRVASEDTTINGVFIPKGLWIEIPIMALQNDPEYWPQPDRFDPDRFLPKAKAARNPYCYMPFGMGPHNCIGMRLALMEMKMAMVHILRKFRFVVCEETQIPLKLEKLKIHAADRIKLRVTARSES